MHGKLFLLLFVLCTLLGHVQAEELNSELAAQVENNPNKDSLEAQRDELLGLLAQVDERYGDVAASLKSVQQQIDATDKSLDKIRQEVNVYQVQINKLNKELAGQVRAAYAMGQQDRLKLLLNQQDPSLSSRMMVYYDYLNKSRLQKLDSLQQYVKYLDQLDKDKLVETAVLEKSLEQKKTEQAVLEEVKKQRNDLADKLNVDFSTGDEQLRLLKASENKLVNLIRKLENEPSAELGPVDSENIESFPKLNGSFVDLKGKLPMPVRGKAVSMFANSPSEEMWKGVLINAKEGAEIKAVNKGKVAYAGTLKGYGLLIIVEHDSEYMSLYAFNQSLYKHKGDLVEAGDVIASVGQSGGRNKPGLYFEIRHQGEAVDPLIWCRN